MVGMARMVGMVGIVGMAGMVEIVGIVGMVGMVGMAGHGQRLLGVRPTSYTPWDVPAAPSAGTWRGSCPCWGHIEHLMHPGTRLAGAPAALGAETCGSRDNDELHGAAPALPAPSRSHGQPGAGPSRQILPEQMAPAWGARRRLSASMLSCRHSGTPTAAPAPAPAPAPAGGVAGAVPFTRVLRAEPSGLRQIKPR